MEEKFKETEIRVIYADTDAMGIVYHANYIKWFEVGRNEFLRQLGYTYARMEEEGIWLPVVSVHVEYKSPGKYDDLLLIRTRLRELKGVSMVMSYEIFRKETGELLVTGYTKHGITSPELKPLRLKKEKPEFYAMMKAEEVPQ